MSQTPERVYGMVTTRNSHRYTRYALESFFRTTPLENDELFFLVDNDRIADREIGKHYPRVHMLVNDSPRSFAENVNQVMCLAETRRADLFFLNNDVIFSENWLAPLLRDEPIILSPLCNQQVTYSAGGFTILPVVMLDDYLGKEQLFSDVARYNSAQNDGYEIEPFIPFFCVKLPYVVYSSVGRLDESFGAGGAEDNDYCLRAYLAGFQVAFAKKSFVLHFSGKSTWNYPEAVAASQIRERTYRWAFEKKWGKNLLDFSVDRKLEVLDAIPGLRQAYVQNDFKQVIDRLKCAPPVGR